MAAENTGQYSGVHNVYATHWPGFNGNPGDGRVPPIGPFSPLRRNTAAAMQRVREGVFGMVMEAWLPFTWSIMSRFIGPRAPTQPFESAFDLDGGERITRFGDFPSAQRPFPYPYEIGYVSNMMPMMDQYSMAWAWAKPPSGPGVNTPIPAAWQISYTQLQKVTG